MSRKGPAYATVLGLVALGLAAPAQAQIWPFGRDRDEAPAEPAETTQPTTPNSAPRRRGSTRWLGPSSGPMR